MNQSAIMQSAALAASVCNVILSLAPFKENPVYAYPTAITLQSLLMLNAAPVP
jgi:hypothetical protein